MQNDLDMEGLLPFRNTSHDRNNGTSHGSKKHQSIPPKIKFMSAIIGMMLPILLPAGHMTLFYLMWGTGDNEVDRKKCSCNCWDTVFKGPYETGVAKYKHAYFNYTSNSLKMWTVTLIFFISLYETFKHIFLLFYKRRLRWSITLIILSSIHSHYYAWWGHWNYWNDDFYPQQTHQLFFTITEIVSTSLALSQLDKKRDMQSIPLLIIASISFFHIALAMKDQFFQNVLQFNGELHQIIRDILLMTTDLLQSFVVLRELRKVAENKGISIKTLALTTRNFWAIRITILLMVLYLLIFRETQ